MRDGSAVLKECIASGKRSRQGNALDSAECGLPQCGVNTICSWRSREQGPTGRRGTSAEGVTAALGRGVADVHMADFRPTLVDTRLAQEGESIVICGLENFAPMPEAV